MTASTLQITYAEIRRSLGLAVGISRSTGDWSTDTAADMEDVIRGGLRMFYSPEPLGPGQPAHQWSFLKSRYTVTTTAPYATGTIAITSGVVTLSGGTWPTWAATSGWLLVNGVKYTIASRDSGTQLTLNDLALTVTSGHAYSLLRYIYDLPLDFDGLMGPLTYDPNEAVTVRTLQHVGEWQLRQKENARIELGQPRLYSHYYKQQTSSTATAGQAKVLELWPAADAAYHITGMIRIIPFSLDATAIYPAGDTIHAQTILAAILADAETYYNGQPGPYVEAFQHQLASSIQHDRQVSSPDTLGRTRFGSPGMGRFSNNRRFAEAATAVDWIGHSADVLP